MTEAGTVDVVGPDWSALREVGLARHVGSTANKQVQ
jgi:hypothetical protein